MNPELRELFEIKQEDGNKKPITDHNVKKHIVIRLAVLVSGSIVFFIGMNEAKGWDGLGWFFFMMIFHALWLLFIIIEAVVLQGNGKTKLRDINVIFSIALIVLYAIGAALFLGGF
ncbi:hypothetical protein C1637_13415 [Chryseobacterium lactis]|uniref:Uncharacterized protein n=1 Tax=Chryseobacterium lactis TaxID=1241981 RepID=A0A3G6RS14_CHRLC|nr:hypothetical protein [Chryseobacterium lactis]AZA83875.1 hypothetical protein EG342_19150 [Chryseobacterium lactis]AZB04260.1 hypothetical protein EG341_10025 [Chryseobacterium lactis]PNW12832.1 hypothetical protein C1637_13415 [Chryseobacterium lactis]